jgi:hypothetical protein
LQTRRFAHGLATFVATCGVQVRAQKFRIQEVISPAGLAVDATRAENHRVPQSTEREADRSEHRPFEDWAQARPLEKQFLTPFPSYLEPYVETTVDGDASMAAQMSIRFPLSANYSRFNLCHWHRCR